MNAANPLVSIVIPTYRRPKLFQEALESVLAQTYTNLDIFITDNSPDTDTKELMQSYLKDKRIKYEHHPEYDALGNWNRAYSYDNPAAKYDNWLMDDDLFYPDKIEKMVAYAEANPGVSLVTSHHDRIDIDGHLLPLQPAQRPILDQTGIISGETAGRILLTTMNVFIGVPTTVLVRKACMHERSRGQGWSGREGRYRISDFPVWLYLLTQGDMLYIREPLSAFRIHDGNGGKGIEVFMKVITCFGIEIDYARETGHFLKDDADYLAAINNWLGIAEYDLHKLSVAKYEYSGRAKIEELAAKFRRHAAALTNKE